MAVRRLAVALAAATVALGGAGTSASVTVAASTGTSASVTVAASTGTSASVTVAAATGTGGLGGVLLPTLPPTPVTQPLTQALAGVTSFIAKACTSTALANNAALSTTCQADAAQVGIDAYMYGIPLMEFLRQAKQQTSVTMPNALSDAPVNQLGSARQLASTAAGHQVFVQPNVDTLYTMGHLDLSKGPLVLHVPRVRNGRYYVFQFLDAYTNIFAYVGTRTTGDGAGNFLITGPGWKGRVPAGMHAISSPYMRAWLCGRTLVAGPSDLPAVHRVQDGYRLIPLAQFLRRGLKWHPPRPKRIVTTHTVATEPTGDAFFDALGTALAGNPPPARDAQILAELRTVGIGPGLHPDAEHLPAPILAGLGEAANAGYQYVYNTRVTYAALSAVEHNGWFVPGADTGNFGSDYTWRAIVALFGLAANEPVEAMYVIGVIDQDRAQLNAARDYVIHFPADQLPPAKYFWSLTMYDSQFALVPNAIGRYALGNRSNLQYNADGSLDIYLQHSPPAGHESNWLPAPATGTFETTLRMYGPAQSALEDTYHYPTITRTG